MKYFFIFAVFVIAACGKNDALYNQYGYGPYNQAPGMGGYGQPLYTGVIVIVAVTGFVVGFNEVNEGMLPTPLAARPIDGVSLVQLYCVATPLKLTAVVDAPLHKVWFDTTFTTGTG
jgi:hypothetical protein